MHLIGGDEGHQFDLGRHRRAGRPLGAHATDIGRREAGEEVLILGIGVIGDEKARAAQRQMIEAASAAGLPLFLVDWHARAAVAALGTHLAGRALVEIENIVEMCALCGRICGPASTIRIRASGQLFLMTRA